MAKNLLLALASTALFLGALEGASRWLRPVSLPYPVVIREAGQWRERYEPDPLLFWKLRPHLVEDGRPFTNSLGLRGPEVPDKAADEFRILSLGESSTFGWEVAYGETYSAVLESRLRTVGARRVRVVNAGVPSYTSFQGYHYLRVRGVELEPDAVLLYFGANDFTPLTFRATRSAPWAEDRGMTDRELFAKRKRPLVRLGSRLLEHSNFYRLIALREPTGTARPDVSRTRSRVPTADRLEILADFRSLCEERGIRLVVVIPWYREFRMHAGLLRDFSRETGVPLVDLPAALDGLPGPRERWFLDDFHPNAEGHRMIAQAIEEALRALWQEPPAPAGQARTWIFISRGPRRGAPRPGRPRTAGPPSAARRPAPGAWPR